MVKVGDSVDKLKEAYPEGNLIGMERLTKKMITGMHRQTMWV
ncbi:hypothetical protein [Paenibacillus riograndensis]|nr:hypothetical protein [Paenibacillus riograndensis]